MLEYVEDSTKLRLSIAEEILTEIDRCALSAYPKETGGFLIGKYTEGDTAVDIRNIVIPTTTKSCYGYFERDTSGMGPFWDKLFKEEGVFYVGEWHSHPNGDSRYSAMDKKTMLDIVSHEAVNIKFPILLIEGTCIDGVKERSFYLTKNTNLKKFQIWDKK